MENIFLQQDAAEKLIVNIDKSTLTHKAKKYFKWRKDITVSRINKLGTAQRDKFIKFLSN